MTYIDDCLDVDIIAGTMTSCVLLVLAEANRLSVNNSLFQVVLTPLLLKQSDIELFKTRFCCLHLRGGLREKKKILLYLMKQPEYGGNESLPWLPASAETKEAVSC